MSLKKHDLLGIREELNRKLIHFSCAVLPLIYQFFLSREQIVLFCSIITILFVIAEILRFRHGASGRLFLILFSKLLREKEKKAHITGATYLFISATVTFIIFKKEIAVPAVLVLTIADSFAAIVGKFTGSVPFLAKTRAGSLTFFFISSVILFLFVPDLGFLVPVVAFLVTLIEALPIPVNDNILVSLSTGIILFFLI
jgi:dolichol kinase